MFGDSAPYNLDDYAASSVILPFCEKMARSLITRSMALAETNRLFANINDYTSKKLTNQMNCIFSMSYYTYDTNAQFNTKIINIEPILATNTIIGTNTNDGNHLDETLNSQRLLMKDDYLLEDLNENDEYLLSSNCRNLQNMSYSFILD